MINDIFAAIGCAFQSILWVICAAVVIILIGVPVYGYWQAGGGCLPTLGLAFLGLGIAYTWGGWGRGKL